MWRLVTSILLSAWPDLLLSDQRRSAVSAIVGAQEAVIFGLLGLLIASVIYIARMHQDRLNEMRESAIRASRIEDYTRASQAALVRSADREEQYTAILHEVKGGIDRCEQHLIRLAR